MPRAIQHRVGRLEEETKQLEEETKQQSDDAHHNDRDNISVSSDITPSANILWSDLNSARLGHDEDNDNLLDDSQEKGTVLGITWSNLGSSGKTGGQGDSATQDTSAKACGELIADTEHSTNIDDDSDDETWMPSIGSDKSDSEFNDDSDFWQPNTLKYNDFSILFNLIDKDLEESYLQETKAVKNGLLKKFNSFCARNKSTP